MARELKRLEKKEEGSKGKTNRYVVSAIALVLFVVLVIVFAILPRDSGVIRKGSVVAQNEGKEKAEETAEQPQATTQQLTIEQVEVPPLSVYRRWNPFKPLVNMEEAEEVVIVVEGGGVVSVPESLSPGLSEESRVISRAVTLHSVQEEDDRLVAKVSIGDQVFDKLKAGEVFAENYKVLAIGKEGSITLLYGDERFTIHAGQTVYW